MHDCSLCLIFKNPAMLFFTNTWERDESSILHLMEKQPSHLYITFRKYMNTVTAERQMLICP